MNPLRLLASPRIQGPLLGIVAVLALVFYAYLGAVVGPEENLEDLHIALINKDRAETSPGMRSSSGTRCSVTFSPGANVKKPERC